MDKVKFNFKARISKSKKVQENNLRISLNKGKEISLFLLKEIFRFSDKSFMI